MATGSKAGTCARAAASDPLPGVVEYIGYGGGRGFPHEWLAFPSAGFAYLVMDTRGQGSVWRRGDTADIGSGANPATPGFMTQGILDRQTYYYRRLYTDAVRAVEAIRSRADVDGERIAVTGASQGGGMSIAVAGLLPDVQVCLADVPFLQHFRRALDITPKDPYPEIARYLQIHRDKIEAVFHTLSYFDGMHFAARMRARALYSVGLMDTICPPSTVYASYNHVTSEKGHHGILLQQSRRRRRPSPAGEDSLPARAVARMNGSQVLILGSGTPNAEADRVSSGVAIAVDDQPYLFDCGHGIVQRVVQAHARGLIAWDSTKLTRLFLTHLHADHTVGLPDLLFTPWIHGRDETLLAFGPAGFERMARHILAAYSPRISANTAPPIQLSADGYKIDAREISEGICYQDERVQVQALKANHGDLAAFSYKDYHAGRHGCHLRRYQAGSGFRRVGARLRHPDSRGLLFGRLRQPTPGLAALSFPRAYLVQRTGCAGARRYARGRLLLYHQLFWGITADERSPKSNANTTGMSSA